MNRILACFILALAYLASGCQSNGLPTNSQQKPTLGTFTKIEKNGLHNVYQFHERLFSGSSPEGEEGFQSLKELGIHTIISVDGVKPDVELARRFGLRYVHIPIGYDGILRTQTLRLAKAARELPGLIYVHCHHGKHRGPAATAAIQLCLDEECSVERVLAEMRQAGTDPHFKGLYDVPRLLIRPTREELDEVPPEFPEAVEVSSLAQLMVQIDACCDRLKGIQAVGWNSKGGLDPSHESLMLVEHYREVLRLPIISERTDQFREMLTTPAGEAVRLNNTLRLAEQTGKLDREKADQSFQQTKASCVQCHEQFRDIRQ